jgi:uncharacterized protein
MDLSTSPGNSNEPSASQSIAIDQPRPVSTAERVQTIDVVRGVALLGILMMNIPGFGIDGSAFNTILGGSHKNADFITFATIETFFSGTMRGLFSMLFGAGMILFTINKKEITGGTTVAEYYYRRLLWLVLFGVLNAFVLLWPGDILFYYGLCGMILFPFRKMRPKWLLLIGIFCIGIGILKTMLWYPELRKTRANYLEAIAAEKQNKKLTEEQEKAKAEWPEIEKGQKTDTARTNENLRTMNSGYTTIFAHFLPNNAGNETWGMYHGLWDLLCMMFIGMALFGWGFFSNKASSSTYWMGFLVGYGIGIPLGLVVVFKGYTGWFNNIGNYIDHYRVPHWVLGDLRRFFLCIGHASLILLIFRSRIVPWLMKALANVGQMAFTNYLMQSIICTLIFYGYGFSIYNDLRFYQLYYVVFAVWIFQLIFSTIWLRYYRFGPFEWLWRSLTYWKKQPMRKNAGVNT